MCNLTSTENIRSFAFFFERLKRVEKCEELLWGDSAHIKKKSDSVLLHRSF